MNVNLNNSNSLKPIGTILLAELEKKLTNILKDGNFDSSNYH